MPQPLHADLRIRLGVLQDVPWVFALMEEAYRDRHFANRPPTQVLDGTLREAITQQTHTRMYSNGIKEHMRCQLWVADVSANGGSEGAGFLLILYTLEGVEIYFGAVKKAYRKSNVARQLGYHVHNNLPEHTKLYTWCFERSHWAIQGYLNDPLYPFTMEKTTHHPTGTLVCLSRLVTKTSWAESLASV